MLTPTAIVKVAGFAAETERGAAPWWSRKGDVECGGFGAL